MNGPEHYAAAEGLLVRATEGIRIAIEEEGSDAALDDALSAQRDAAAVAQVHATLALTGVLATLVPPDGSGKYRAWDTATGSLGEAGGL